MALLVTAMMALPATTVLAFGAVASTPAIGPAASSLIHVQSTVDLYAGNLHSGSWVPPNYTARASPYSVVADARDGTILVSTGDDLYGGRGGSVLLDESTGRTIATYGAGGGFTLDVFVPSEDSFFVAWTTHNQVVKIDGSTGAVLAYVSVGSSPVAVTYDNGSNEVYVANYNSRNLTILNATTNVVLGSVPVCCHPEGLGFDGLNGDLYVPTAANVTVISAANHTVLASIDDPYGPIQIAEDNGSGTVFVCNANFQNMTLINGTTNRKIGELAVNGICTGVAADPLNGTLYVSDYSASVLTVVRGATHRVLGFLTVGLGANGLCFDPVRNHLFITRPTAPRIEVYDAGHGTFLPTLTFTILRLTAAQFDPSNGILYVADGFGAQLFLVDTSKRFKVGTLGVGGSPCAFALDEGGHRLFVANCRSDNVSVVDTTHNRVLHSIRLDGRPISMAFDPETGRLFISHYTHVSGVGIGVLSGSSYRWLGNVSAWVPYRLSYDALNDRVVAAFGDVGGVWPNYVSYVEFLNPATLIWQGKVPVPTNGSAFGIAIASGSGTLYVGAQNYTGSSVIWVINPANSKVVRTINLSLSADCLALDDAAGELFVTGGGVLTVLSVASGSVVQTVHVGFDVTAVVLGRPNGAFFVLNRFTGTVSVLS